jgi:hypothetical protein
MGSTPKPVKFELKNRNNGMRKKASGSMRTRVQIENLKAGDYQLTFHNFSLSEWINQIDLCPSKCKKLFLQSKNLLNILSLCAGARIRKEWKSLPTPEQCQLIEKSQPLSILPKPDKTSSSFGSINASLTSNKICFIDLFCN